MDAVKVRVHPLPFECTRSDHSLAVVWVAHIARPVPAVKIKQLTELRVGHEAFVDKCTEDNTFDCMDTGLEASILGGRNQETHKCGIARNQGLGSGV